MLNKGFLFIATTVMILLVQNFAIAATSNTQNKMFYVQPNSSGTVTSATTNSINSGTANTTEIAEGSAVAVILGGIGAAVIYGVTHKEDSETPPIPTSKTYAIDAGTTMAEAGLLLG